MAWLARGGARRLALALQRQAAVYTTDAAWKSLGLNIEVNVIRREPAYNCSQCRIGLLA